MKTKGSLPLLVFGVVDAKPIMNYDVMKMGDFYSCFAYENELLDYVTKICEHDVYRQKQ